MSGDLKKIFKEIKGEKRFNEEMCLYTSFRIGGIADLILFPEDIDDLKNVIQLSNKHRIPLFILGYGTNILVRDKGIRGVIVSLVEGFKEIEMIKITEKIAHVVVGAGLKLSKLLKFSIETNLGGCECLSGIPGSVGGAVKINAGTKTGEIKNILKNVRIIDNKGKVKILDKDKISFGYRKSNFPDESVILDAELILKKSNKKAILRKVKENLNSRQKSQPVNFPCAGSIFKNLDNIKAYRVVNDIGMQGAIIGQAQVSEKHSNFIINNGNAKASDVIRLINEIKGKAKKEKGIVLEPEIVIVGEQSSPIKTNIK